MIDILLVDDETYVTESLELTIPWGELGVTTVLRAASGKEALQILEENAVDLVVTDIRMPGMSGLELVEEVSSRWAHIRCILLTGHSDFQYAKKAIQLQAADYILKPVNDEEFMASVSAAITSLRDDWDEFDKYHRLLYSRKSDYKILRENLMHDLLLGREITARALGEQLEKYEIVLQPDQPAVMMLIRLTGRFSAMDQQSLDLMEFAVGNIAEEVFGPQFNVWFGRGPHESLVMMIQSQDWTEPAQTNVEELKQPVGTFREHVIRYLQGDLSMVVTAPFQFADLTTAYRKGLGSLVLSGPEENTIIYMDKELSKRPENDAAQALEELYKPPVLPQLLETKQWEAAARKLNAVFDAADRVCLSREHVYEMYLSVTNAFMYIAHKQGHLVHEIDHAGFDLLLAHQLIQSPDKLRRWATEMLAKLQEELSDQEGVQSRRHVIKQVQEMVTRDAGQDLSVKMIADKVYLHPVYLSKIYKAETGEGLGDYMIRMRMERALYLLKNTNKKIYEITSELGYQNPQYFSKMFKKHYGMTPNEYRDQA
ncbi:response regulator [Paenibacillus marchantiae]|uniref:response regulator n=1 Tax=Paenibacillus TaxID=44249 RepID=UPI0008823467|nr:MULTISPECIES: response regulator [Paenibacillus]WDQ35613.1 response regulator [Paenibacillus marchantiae]SDJ91504.1 two-component system, response regulator YesN [Paenibacillus sp. OK060]